MPEKTGVMGERGKNRHHLYKLDHEDKL